MKSLKKLITAALALAMIFVPTGCANPPGEESGTTIAPGAGAINETPVVESGPITAEKVDFSVLTEEELGKIDEYLLAQLKEMSATDTTEIKIRFTKELSSDEFDTRAENQYEKNQERYAEISTEIAQLNAQKDSVKTEKTISSQILTVEDIDIQIDALLEEQKYLCEYNYAVNQTFDEVYGSRMEEFVDEYFMEQADTVEYYNNIRSVYGIYATPTDIIKAVQSEEVLSISIPEPLDLPPAFDNFSLTEDSSSIIEDTTQLSATKINEVYNLIDGEVAVNAGSDAV